MSDFQLNGFVKSLFAGYGEAKKEQQLQHRFDELEWTPFLFSSSYLIEMYDLAATKEEHESILEHLYKHSGVIDQYRVFSYKNIEKKIIDKYYEKPKAKLYVFPGGKK